MGGFFGKTFLPAMNQVVKAHMPYEDSKRLVKVPST